MVYFLCLEMMHMSCLFRKTIETYLNAVNVRLDVASLVKIYDVHRPQQWTACRECCRTDTIQDLLARWLPPQTLSLPVSMNSLKVGKCTKHRIKSASVSYAGHSYCIKFLIIQKFIHTLSLYSMLICHLTLTIQSFQKLLLNVVGFGQNFPFMSSCQA